MGSCAQANFRYWNDALQTKDPAAVARLYSPRDLSFLPTVSPMHISKMEETNDYFTAFVKKDPFGTITDESVQVYENGKAYLHSGMYTFDLGQGSARAPVEARFSYMWRWEDGAWKISHHHSSVRPAGHGGSKPAAGQASISMYSAGSQTKTPAGIDVARANFRSWNHALQTKDPAAVARLYSPRDLSFLPTVSPMHISKMEETNQYFTAFVKKDPFGTITDESVQVYENGNAYLHSGMYTFDLGQGIARAPVEARFSYMWRWEDGAWKISHHHSSVRPAGHGGSKTASATAGCLASLDVASVSTVVFSHARTTVCFEILSLFL
jgi:uncharacterized protein (TIGR02246 family)